MVRSCLSPMWITWVGITWAGAGWAFAQDDFSEHASHDAHSAESLFEWQYDGNWESPATEHDRIVTDRPHLAEATSTVGLGTVQLETGFSFSNDRSAGVRTQSYSYPEPLLRVGAFAEWFELRLGWNYLNEQSNPQVGPKTSVNGSDDLYVGAN